MKRVNRNIAERVVFINKVYVQRVTFKGKTTSQISLMILYILKFGELKPTVGTSRTGPVEDFGKELGES